MGITQVETDEKEIQINVITLRAYLSEQAMSQALDEGMENASIDELKVRMDELLMTTLSDAKEFVEVNDHFIRVGINCNLIDDNAISQALEMVGRLDSFKPGTMVQMGQLVHVYENKISRRKRAN